MNLPSAKIVRCQQWQRIIILLQVIVLRGLPTGADFQDSQAFLYPHPRYHVHLFLIALSCQCQPNSNKSTVPLDLPQAHSLVPQVKTYYLSPI